MKLSDKEQKFTALPLIEKSWADSPAFLGRSVEVPVRWRAPRKGLGQSGCIPVPVALLLG